MLLGAGTCPGLLTAPRVPQPSSDQSFRHLTWIFVPCFHLNHRMLWDIFTHSLQVLLGGVESTCRAWAPPEPPGASPGQAGCRHSSVSLTQPAWTAQHLPGLGGDLQQLLRLECRREQSWCFVQGLWHPHSCHSLCGSQLLSNPKTFLTHRSFAL